MSVNKNSYISTCNKLKHFTRKKMIIVQGLVHAWVLYVNQYRNDEYKLNKSSGKKHPWFVKWKEILLPKKRSGRSRHPVRYRWGLTRTKESRACIETSSSESPGRSAVYWEAPLTGENIFPEKTTVSHRICARSHIGFKKYKKGQP